MNLPAILRNPSLLLRLAIDLLLLHISMFFAITCASIFYTMSAGATSQSLLNAELLQSYEILALGIAPLFLVVLYFGGVYDRRWSSESSEKRMQRLMRAVGIASLVCLAPTTFSFATTSSPVASWWLCRH